MHPTPMHNDSDEGNNAVQENSDNDNFDEDDNVLQKNLHAPLGVPRQTKVYTGRERHPPDTEFKVVQGKLGPSEPVARWRTRMSR